MQEPLRAPRVVVSSKSGAKYTTQKVPSGANLLAAALPIVFPSFNPKGSKAFSRNAHGFLAAYFRCHLVLLQIMFVPFLLGFQCLRTKTLAFYLKFWTFLCIAIIVGRWTYLACAFSDAAVAAAGTSAGDAFGSTVGHTAASHVAVVLLDFMSSKSSGMFSLKVWPWLASMTPYLR